MDKHELAKEYIKEYNITWESISEEQLYVLAVELNFPDSLVGHMLGATKEQVRYKRRKYKIRIF